MKCPKCGNDLVYCGRARDPKIPGNWLDKWECVNCDYETTKEINAGDKRDFNG